MKLTKIGIVLAAMLAISALTASAASALEFNSNKSPATLTGTSGNTTHVFKVDGETASCTAEYTPASLVTPRNSVPNIKVTYSSCVIFGIPGGINMGGCTYEFRTPNDTPAIMGKFGIWCTDPKNDYITLFSKLFGTECEVRIGETNNTSLSTLSYENDKPKAGTLRVTANVSGITVNKTKDNGSCPLAGTGATNTVTYSGTTDVQEILGGNIAIA